MTRSTPPVVIDGDVHDPTGALAHVQACTHFVQQLSLQAEIAANNLEGLGVGGEAVGEIRGLQDAAAQFLAAADAAAERFTHHVRAQADLAANPALAGTTAGTYLDAARA